MELHIPPPELIPYGLRALKCVAAADGTFGDHERALLTAAQKLFGSAVDVDALAPITPAELAEKIQDPGLRQQLVRAMVLLSLSDGEASAPEAAICAAFREALEVDAYEVDTLRKLAEGHLWMARVDVFRRFWARERFLDEARKRGITWAIKGIAALLKIAEDREMSAKYRALGELPEGTLGRAYYDSMIENDFPFPGEKGAGPEIIIIHDLTHILGGYGTDAASEICVSAFHAGYRRKDPFTFLMFTMMEFQLGIHIAPLAEPSTMEFDPERVLEALRRGSLMNADLTDGTWDYWADLPLPVSEVRAKYGVVPERALAVS